MNNNLQDLDMMRKLTMHSAPITSLCMAASEKGLYSGDAKGRQILWTDCTAPEEGVPKRGSMLGYRSRSGSFTEEVREKLNKLIKS